MGPYGCRLLSALSRRLCRGRGPAAPPGRALRLSAGRLQPAGGRGGDALAGRVDRFGGVSVDLADSRLPPSISEEGFSRLLRGQWGSLISRGDYTSPE